ncbi:MAG TPA: two-component regulator propeller domain-containing protein [Blastocatellia bacterium]|nr:two-component regulator propeller domain-containing protein [Blastocatellia bacterium]
MSIHFRFLLLTLASCLSLSAYLFATSPTSLNLHQWGAVSLFHGLPSNHVRAIAQDGDRIFWFGTDGGLVKYDGRRIQRLATEGMLAGRVRAIKVDPDGVLWVGTDEGAARIVRGEIRPIAETEGKTITAIITPERGRGVIATAQGALFDCSTNPDGSLAVQTIGREDHPLLNIDQGAPLQLTSLAVAGGRLLVGTRSRGVLSIEQGAVKEILSRNRAYFVEALEADSEGRPWFGAQTTTEDSGLFESADMLRPLKIGAGTGTVLALKFDARGDLWVGTDGQGVFRYRDSRRVERFTFENTAGGLRSNHIYAVFVDAEGVVWFGTDRGVCRYDPQSPHIEKVSDDPESNFARALFQSSDKALWCGTNRGLFVRDEAAGAWVAVEELKGKTVHSISEAADGRLLVGTSAGLFSAGAEASPRAFARLDAEASGDAVRAICKFQGATYVAVYGRGVERLEGTRRTLIWPADNAGSRERQVISLHAEPGRLWIGTVEAGVFVFDGKQVSAEESLVALKGATVRALAGTRDGRLWVATARGLYLLKEGRLAAVLEEIDARSLAARGDNAWCATTGGLYRVLADDEASPIIARLDTEQGLPSQNAFAVISTEGPEGHETLWAATSRGVVRYEPGLEPPRLALTRVMGRRVYSGEEIEAGLDLEYPQSSLSVDVAATGSRTFPEQFQYSFSVFDGKDRLIARRLSRDSQLLMDNLRPGRHRVEVRAYTNDLVASPPLTFGFNVERAPFPWTTTALSVLLTLALVAVWWGWRQNRRIIRANSALGSANRQLAETRMQLATETETERRRIARDLHDQTLADLRRLMLMADHLPAAEAGNGHRRTDPAAFRGEIESITTEIRRICEDLSPSALANVGLAAALEYALANAVAHMPTDKRFDYEFTCDGALDERIALAPAVEIQIYRIVQEALSNICRHSAATRVRLEVSLTSEGELTVMLEDNGKGFDPKTNGAKTGRGLANIRSRASLIEADAGWSRGEHGGAVFTLRKPAAARVTTQ